MKDRVLGRSEEDKAIPIFKQLVLGFLMEVLNLVDFSIN